MNTQMHVPPLSFVNKVLISVMVGAFVLSSILQTQGISLTMWLGLSLDGLSKGLIYQLVTFPLIEHGLFSVLFSGLILWFIGSELESSWGMRRYIYFLLSCLGFGALFFILVATSFSIYAAPLSGMSGVASGLCIAYAVLYPDRIFTFMLLFPMRARYFCLILAALSLYNGFFSPAKAGAWGQIGMMLGAFLWVAWQTGLLSQSLAKAKKRVPKSKASKKGHLRLVEKDTKNDDEDPPPRYWQ
jgi:membrane associated rhomboid family serine protease